MNVNDKNVIETIDEQVEKLKKSLHDGQPLHMRDKRVEPDDGYGNYVTIVEAQITDAIQHEQKAAIDTLTQLKQYILAEGLY